MSGINKVILIGRLGKDVEMKYTQGGDAIANISIATSEKWKDKQTGEQKEKTDWHKVVIFGKLAEIAGQYLQKGSNVYLEGKLQTRKWTNQQGQDQYTTEVVLQGYGGVMQMLDGKPQGQQPQQQQQGFQNQGNQIYQQPQQQPSQQLAQKRQQAQQQQPHVQQPMATDFNDDIPFAPIGLQYNNVLVHVI